MKTVVRYLGPYKLIMAMTLLFKTLASFSELLIPSIMATIIDEDVPTGDTRRVLVSGGLMLVFAFFTLGLNIIANRLAARVSARVSYDLRRDLFQKTVLLDTASTDEIGIPSLTARLTSDTYNLASFMARMLRMGVKAPLTVIGGLVITLFIDARLALILVAVLPLVGITVYFITKRSIPMYNEERMILDSLVRRVDETHSGIRVIKALSKCDYEREKFSGTSKKLTNQEIKAGRLVSLTKPVNDLLFYFGFSGVIALGAFLAANYNFDAVGKLLAFMTYFTMILNSMIMMTRIFVSSSRSFASAARIEEVLLRESTLDVTEGDTREGEPFIVFDGVTFSYNKHAPNVSDVSFTLERGETLGIIGVTGSGKTTLASLLMRLYDPDSGEIRIGGRSLKSIPKDELYSMFGVAFQNDFVYSASVDENVSFFRERMEGELLEAAEVAMARDFIEAHPEGFDRLITTGGTNISGGQKQRLTVARSVLYKPEILILDDASSALDYKTDAALRASIRERVNSTTVIIAQRASSVMACDKIIMLDSGRVIASGTHSELMESSPEYREIAILQMGGDAI